MFFGLKIVGHLRGSRDATRLGVDYHRNGLLAVFGVVDGGNDHVQPMMNECVKRGYHLDVLDCDAESFLVLLGYPDYTHFSPVAVSQRKKGCRTKRN